MATLWHDQRFHQQAHIEPSWPREADPATKIAALDIDLHTKAAARCHFALELPSGKLFGALLVSYTILDPGRLMAKTLQF